MPPQQCQFKGHHVPFFGCQIHNVITCRTDRRVSNFFAIVVNILECRMRTSNRSAHALFYILELRLCIFEIVLRQVQLIQNYQ